MKSIFKISSRIALFLSLFMATMSIAQTIAVVELQQVFQKSTQAKKLSAKLEKAFTPKQAILKDKQRKLQSKVREYEKNKLTMSEDEVQLAEEQILTLRSELQQYSQSLKKEFQEQQQALSKKLDDIVSNAISTVAKKQKIDLVIFQGFAYHKKKYNITDLVIKELAKKSK